MPGRPNILEILKQETAAAADQALLAALREVDAQTAQEIVALLLLRNQQAGLYGLIEHFHEFEEPICQGIMEHMDELFGVLRLAAQSREEQVRLNALEVIRRGCAYRAAYLVDTALHDRSSRIREAAAETLHALADHLLQTSPVREEPGDQLNAEEAGALMTDLEDHLEDRRQVIGAIEGGLASYGIHLRPKVIEAAMWFVDDLGMKFWAVAGVPGSKPAHAAISIIAGMKSPRLVPFCMMALNYGTFRAPVAKSLGLCVDPVFLEEWIRQSWRLAEPKVARAMAAIKELVVFRNRLADLLAMSPALQRHMPRWINVTGVSDESKAELLKDLYRHGDRRIRRTTTWSLITRMDDRSVSLLRSISRDDDQEAAAIARYELALRYPLEYPPAELGTEGGDREPVWGRAAPGLTFEQYWVQFDRMADEDRVRKGQEMLAANATAVRLLSRRLSSSEFSERARALRMITLLGLVEDFTEQLYRLCYDQHPEVRSSAVAALGHLPGPVTKRVLRKALNDEDSRVQANAVEAVERTGDPSRADDLLPLLASPDNRVRANAVKALLKVGVREAAVTLLKMLNDSNRAQRISALWLIDHMGLFTLATRVLGLAQSDQDAVVRQRAQNLASSLAGRTPAGVGR